MTSFPCPSRHCMRTHFSFTLPGGTKLRCIEMTKKSISHIVVPSGQLWGGPQQPSLLRKQRPAQLPWTPADLPLRFSHSQMPEPGPSLLPPLPSLEPRVHTADSPASVVMKVPDSGETSAADPTAMCTCRASLPAVHCGTPLGLTSITGLHCQWRDPQPWSAHWQPGPLWLLVGPDQDCFCHCLHCGLS